MPGCDVAGMAKRSYSMSKVRGSGLGCQDAKAQEQLRGATARPRSGATVERSYPASEARGGDLEKPPGA